MKKLWSKISPNVRGKLVGVSLFLLVIFSMWRVWTN